MGLGENIKKYRMAYSMDQKELGKALNVSDKTVSSWECERTEPKIGMLERIAEVFGVTKTDIIEGRIYKSYNSPEEFELDWRKLGGGRHPIELSDTEHEIILSYRVASDGIKDSINKLLDIKIAENKDMGKRLKAYKDGLTKKE